MVVYRLTQPTGFQILEWFSDGRRDVASNVAHELDIDRGYLNGQLQSLSDYGLLDRVGPAERAGLYEITPKGVAALENRDVYDADREQFTDAVEKTASKIRIEEPSIHIAD
jgi:DNA-binding MarR family transcriptional regulator